MSLNGTVLNFAFYWPTLNDLEFSTDSAVGGGTNIALHGGEIVFQDDMVTYSDTIGGGWNPWDFNGFVISDTGDVLPEIGGITFTVNNISFDTSLVTFDGDTIFINLRSQSAVLGVNFAFKVEFVPSEIALSSLSVTEKTAGAIIGDLTVTDANTTDSHVLSVDDSRFEIVGGQLKLKDGVALDFDDAASIDVKITAGDSFGLTYDEVLTIAVADVVERFVGNRGDDRLIGTRGADILRGRQGDDVLKGRDGDDSLRSMGGNDKFWGGGGADTFIFSRWSARDRIMDFETGIDKIVITRSTGIEDFADLKRHASNHVDDLWITAGKDVLIIKHFSKADLDAGDFIF